MRRPVVWLMAGLGLFSLILSGYYFLFSNITLQTPPVFPLIFGITVWILAPVFLYRAVKKNWNSKRRTREKIEFEFTNEKIIKTGETYKVELSWEKTFMVKEFKNWIVIYQSKHNGDVIPKIAFGDKLDEFKKIVKSKNFETNF